MSCGTETTLRGAEDCQLQAFVHKTQDTAGTLICSSHECIELSLPVGLSNQSFDIVVDQGGLGLIIFHPYAHLGGSCDDPVVLTIFRHDIYSSASITAVSHQQTSTGCLCRQAMRTEAVQTVVRYNQRGIGASSGSKSVWGVLDLADAVSVCQHVLSLPDGPKQLHLIG